MPFVTASDGCQLHYEEHGSGSAALLLIHGWSGSSKYFTLNVDELAKKMLVVTVDLRFHGRSDKPDWGFSVARLAADLSTLLMDVPSLAAVKPSVLGSSLGCAIIWSYIELFGESRLNKLIFVDQAPSQWLLSDWTLGSKGIYDAASLTNIQKAVQDLDSFADGNAECCLSKPVAAEVMALLKAETLLCTPSHLSALMADHACRAHALDPVQPSFKGGVDDSNRPCVWRCLWCGAQPQGLETHPRAHHAAEPQPLRDG